MDAVGSTLFDLIVVVDWSANARPKRGRDSIWIAAVATRSGVVERVENPSTRSEAVDLLASVVERHADERILIGVDFSLGYPEGAAAAFGCDDTSWRGLWGLLTESIDDDDRNANNRFSVASELNRRSGRASGPFWGCPPSGRTPHLGSTKVVAEPLPEWRHTESVLRAGGRRPFSCWQLLGAGAVGSQSLVGIPALVRLRDLVSTAFDVWPFTTGLREPTVAPGGVVVAEVWPSLVSVPLDESRCRDESQVRALSGALARLDRDGHLRDLFTPSVEDEHLGVVIDEEGWVLGVGSNDAAWW